MKVRLRFVLPTVLLLAGCASTLPTTEAGGFAAPTSAAPPQRVDAASLALGQRLDAMLAAQRPLPVTLTR